VGERAQAGEVAVIVVVVAEENGVDCRKIREGDAGRVDTARTDQAEETDAFAEDGIGEQRKAVELEEKRGVIDPRRDDFGRTGRRRRGRFSRRDRARRPVRDAAGETPAKHLPKRRRWRRARGEKAGAVAVIGNGEPAHRRRSEGTQGRGGGGKRIQE